jgi:DNA-binding SARP family transcriptional activator
VQGSRREAIVERLWPGDDGANASRLKVALHRLRRVVGESDAVLSHANTLRLNADRVRVDAWELEALTRSESPPELASVKALRLYSGPFVADIASDPSILIYQQHLERRFDATILAGMQALAEAGRVPDAIELALQGLMRMQSGGQILPMARDMARRFGQSSQEATLEAFAAGIEQEAAR